MRSRIALAIAAAVSLTASGRSETRQTPIFRARTAVVSVAVSVTKDRVPVTGLAPADFELTDNGVRQTVDDALHDSVPIDLTLIVTAFPVERTGDHDGFMALGAATRAALQSEDRLRLVTVDQEVAGAVVSHEYSLLADPVVRTWSRGDTRGGFGLTSGGFSGWGVALADGVFYALAWPVEPTRRHLVVALTDGWDTASAIEMDMLPKFAARSDAVLHFVFWRSPGEDSGNAGGRNIVTSSREPLTRRWQTSFNTMDAVVRQTGGTLQRAANAAEALRDIVADFRSSYVLRYTPAGVRPGGWHELKVKLTRPGSFTLRARKGYEGLH